MSVIIAYCGLVCSDCKAYIATQANDVAALEEMVAQAREQFNAPDLTLESGMCDGCPTETGRKCGYCFECEIRACGVARGIANCAYCADYACDKLTAFLSQAPDARASLEGIRSTLL